MRPFDPLQGNREALIIHATRNFHTCAKVIARRVPMLLTTVEAQLGTANNEGSIDRKQLRG